MTNAGRSRFIASQGGLPVVLYPTDQFPTIASIPTGAVVYDTTDGVVKQKRQVGNFVNNGGTTSTDYVTLNSSFDPNQNFHLELLFSQDASDPVYYTGLFTQGTGAAVTRGLWIERVINSADYSVKLYNSLGESVTIVLRNIIKSKYNKVVIKNDNGLFCCFVNDLLSDSILLNGFVSNVFPALMIGTNKTARTINGKIAHCKLIQGSAGFDFCFCEGAGSVAVDSSGNGNNGTITDGAPNSFWDVKDLVPLSLLS